MSQVVHNSGITYGNNNRDCGNSYNQCNISIPDGKSKILEWISPFASRERHQAVRDSRVERVGDWLLCSPSFSTWRASEDRTVKPVLFCYGHPGAGKTYISSLVIDTLLSGICGHGVAVAYVYCDFTTRNMQSPGAVLGSVLRQVVGALEEIPDEVQQAFGRAKMQADGCGLRLPEILDMLTKFLPSLKRAFICIDALDEFPTKQRAQLWKSLQCVVRECPNTRLFLTGRPQIRTEVEDYLPEEAAMVTIEPTLEDIRRYIEERLNEDLDKSTIDEKLRADIRRVIPKRVAGIFLLVCLGMDEIIAATTVHQKRQALDRMSNGLGLQDAYNTTLDRIRQQDGGKSKLGMAVLMWVSRCERPLQWEELRHALGVDLGAEELTIDNLPSVRTVLGCTLGLVTIDQEASTVRLLHLTLEEYLGGSPTLFQTPQSMMAEICLTYLNFPSIRERQPNFSKVLETWPFLKYAASFWGTHATREMTEKVKSRALRLLDGYENHVSATVFGRERILAWYFGEVRGISGLHCIAFWGIAEIAIAMLEAKKWDVNGRDSRGDTPLMWAARYGNDRVVELLLMQGDIRPDEVTRDGRTALSFAAESGNEGAVKLLLERDDLNLNLGDNGGRTPLSYAAPRGYEGVVKLLLERSDANPDSSDKSGRTPLSFAALGGHEDLVKLLLERNDLNSNLGDDGGQTPLSYAVSREYEGVVKLLLERDDLNSNLGDDGGRTPLLYAVSREREGVVKLLLERDDLNPNLGDDSGRTPLSYAASRGCEGVVKLLLERGDINPNSLDSNGRPPLSYAAAGKHGAVVKLLVESRGIDPNSSDSDGLTPLSYAARWGREDLLKRFLGREGINPNLSDKNCRTPLLFAAFGGHEGSVKLLLDHRDANPDPPDMNGRTPLSFAAFGGHEGIVKLLLERGDVNPDSSNMNGRTPLSFAALGGHEGLVKLLQERSGVNPNLLDNDGQHPCYDTMTGREGEMRLFLQS